jgi:hypothetical protein
MGHRGGKEKNMVFWSGNLKGGETFCRPRHGRYDSIKMDNEETAWEGGVAFF